jgi:mono/diheme cytochrome c family protein
MKHSLTLGLLLFLVLGLVMACNFNPMGSGQGSASQPGMGMGMGRGMGMGNNGMMARHMATVDADYAGLTNPISADEASLARGEEIYTASCATCHGDGGMGDGPAGTALDPAPAPLAHTSQMLGDDYLFWRISEGGIQAPFNSAMPGWKEALDEQARWDVINYIRALGNGQVMPRQGMGGATFDPAAEAAQQAEMLAQGVEQGVITAAEADTFSQVHAAIETVRGQMQENMSGGMTNMRNMMLQALVTSGTITQAQADDFVDIHDRLVEAGLMQ